MARSVNKVILLGHIGRDAENRYTPSGIAKTQFSIATERRWKDSGSGEWKSETDWHNVVVWRKEKLAEYLTKGQQVYIEGRLQTRSYEDKEGNKRYTTEVVADEVVLCGGSRGERDSDGVVSRPRGQQRQAEEPAGTPYSQDVADDDDVPF